MAVAYLSLSVQTAEAIFFLYFYIFYSGLSCVAELNMPHFHTLCQLVSLARLTGWATSAWLDHQTHTS